MTTLNYADIIAEHGSPLLVLDCQKVIDQYQLLKSALPKAHIYYALKALPHIDVIHALHSVGASFEIASTGEISLLHEAHINPRATIHTHPIKRDSDIRDALRFGTTTFVIDNPDELSKFISYRDRVGLLIRISFRGDNAVVDLSKKFGCAPEQALHLLNQARQLGLHVKGFSFHVGSQSTTPDAHVNAINICQDLIEKAYEMGAILNTLDIGGGFPVTYDNNVPDIMSFCTPIQAALASLPPHIDIIAEPGRYLVAPAMTALCSVIGKAKRDKHFWYYLNDGVYGSFSGQIYDHARYPISVLCEGPTFPSVLAGPTCDSIDVIAEDILLPELNIHDIVIGHMMGAYTIASASNFNSFEKTKVFSINKPVISNIRYIA